MTPDRARALIADHALLRKRAFDLARPGVDRLFAEARTALDGVKTAGELATFDPAFRRHFAEP